MDPSTPSATVRQALSLADVRARLGGLAAVLLGACITVTEMVGAGIVVVTLDFAAGGDSPSMPVVGDLTDLLPGSDRDADLAWLAIVGVAFFIVRAALTLMHLYVLFRASFGLGVRLSRRVAEASLDRPFAWHLDQNSSDLATNAIIVTQQYVVGVFTPVLSATSQILVMVGLLALVTVVTPVAAGLSLAILGTTAAITLGLTRRQLLPLGQIEVEENSRSLRLASESFRAVREVKIHDMADAVLERISGSRRRWARAQRRRALLVATPRVLIEAATFGTLLVFVAFRTSGDALASLGLLGYVVLRLLPSINTTIANVNSVRGNVGSADVLMDLLHDSAPPAEVVGDFRPVRRLGTGIELSGLSFGYNDHSVLRDIDLRIGQGRCVGIVGTTGSGKSTLLNVMIGLLDPTSGSVTVGGRAMNEVRREWWRVIAVVPQDIALIDDTLEANITLADSSHQVREATMHQALMDADLLAFVDELREGLATRIGEDGTRLSGGQRQRIAIARALYRRPRVLFFDEATSALDHGTERRIIERVTRGGDRTIVMIAHRTDTLKLCDEIVRVENGLIVERGSFESVLGRSSSS